MTKFGTLFSGIVIVLPFLIGALLSGTIYFAEGATIPITLFQAALILGFIFFGIKKFTQFDTSFSVYGLEKEYFLFLAIIFFSLIYSPEREQGIFYALRYIVLIAMTYLIYNSVNTYKELKVICYSMISVSVLIALYNILDIYSNPEVLAFNYVNKGAKLLRSSGAETDPNIFASNYFLPLMILATLIGNSQNKRNKIILFSLFLIIIFSVLFTYSRSSWVSIFFGLLITIFVQRKYSIISYSLIILLLVFVGSDGFRSLFFSIWDRVLDIFAGSSDDSSKFRIILFKTAFLIWLDSYTFGIGYQGFSTAFQKYYSVQQTAGVYEPHNEYYMVLSELGTIGFIVFVWMLWKIIKQGWHTINLDIANNQNFSFSLGIFSSFIAYLIFFQFLGGMHLHSLFMINIGLLFTCSKLSIYKLTNK